MSSKSAHLGAGSPLTHDGSPRRPWRFFLCTGALLLILSLSLDKTELFLPASVMLLPNSFALAASLATPLLEVLQLTTPVVIPEDADCTQTLMVHSFANSYNQPFVGTYSPPSCTFNRVTFNFTVTSAGRQFDRLGAMYFNDTEIFRTSTAEPTANGIEWTYLKDMTAYLSLFQEPQKIIFDLGNLINDIYTAPFNTTLTATFIQESNPSLPTPADIILPVSRQLSASDEASWYQIPDQNITATNSLNVPQNAVKAFFSISATGQSTEEFWFANVPSQLSETFTASDITLYPYSPFREVQLHIDGTFAGVASPFPIIFTGGVVPGLWRPLVGIDAFDLLEDVVDVTPFLPLLCDGSPHSFEIRVVGISNDEDGNPVLSDQVGSYWVVTGKLFLWLDSDSSHVTTGTKPSTSSSINLGVDYNLGKTSNGTNNTLTYDVTAQRELSVTSSIKTSTGARNVTWTQSISYSNFGNLTEKGWAQANTQRSSGNDVGTQRYTRAYSYPVYVYNDFSQPPNGNLTINGIVNRTKDVTTFNSQVYPTGLEEFDNGGDFDGAEVLTHQNGSAFYTALPDNSASYSAGSTEQDYTFFGWDDEGVSTELYERHVLAVNGTIVEDTESGATDEASLNVMHTDVETEGLLEFAPTTLAKAVGRHFNTRRLRWKW